MSINVILRGRIYEAVGYAMHTRGVALSLHKANVNIRLIPLKSSSKLGKPHELYDVISSENKKIFRLLQGNKLNRNYFSLELCTPDYWRRDKKADRNIGFTTFETDAIPDSWKDIINRIKDEVWVTTKFHQEAFRKAGVKIPISVVPEGFDTDIFNPNIEPLNLPGKQNFNFLSIFHWNPRKDWQKLVLAFLLEFKKTEGVRLILKIHDLRSKKNNNIKMLHGYLEKINYKNAKSKILILHDILPENMLPHLYTACQAFVLATRGEGWCRPYSEALLCKLPVIYSQCSAMLCNLNEKIAFPVKGKMIEVRETFKKEPNLLNGWIVKDEFLCGKQRWFENDIDSLRMQMRNVYENYKAAKKKAALGRQWIAENYSLDKVKEVIIDRLSSATH